MTFLPPDYKLPKRPSSYMSLETGDNKFRVLSEAVMGYELWVNKKAVRRSQDNFSIEERLGADIDVYTKSLKVPQYFWAFAVWNYTEKRVQVLQISKKTIFEAFMGILTAWGDPKEYDITITKKGEKKDTTYLVLPNKPEKLAEEIQQVTREIMFNPESFLEGKEPFSKIAASPSKPVPENF